MRNFLVIVSLESVPDHLVYAANPCVVVVVEDVMVDMLVPLDQSFRKVGGRAGVGHLTLGAFGSSLKNRTDSETSHFHCGE